MCSVCLKGIWCSFQATAVSNQQHISCPPLLSLQQHHFHGKFQRELDGFHQQHYKTTIWPCWEKYNKAVQHHIVAWSQSRACNCINRKTASTYHLSSQNFVCRATSPYPPLPLNGVRRTRCMKYPSLHPCWTTNLHHQRLRPLAVSTAAIRLQPTQTLQRRRQVSVFRTRIQW